MANKFDFLLSLFCGKDKIREWMLKPNEQGEFVYATDAHSLIKVPKSECENEYPPHEKTANFASLYENYNILEEPFFVSRAKLSEILLGIEKEYDKSECEECRGDGTVTCDYNHEHECPDCDGEGEIVNRSAPKIYPREDHLIKINTSCFSPFYMNKLLQVANELETNRIKIVSHFNLKATIFRFENVDVVSMPIYPQNMEDWSEKTKHVLYEPAP